MDCIIWRRYYDILFWRLIINYLVCHYIVCSGKNFGNLVNESIETLKRGNKIIATGLGKNVPICEKFVDL